MRTKLVNIPLELLLGYQKVIEMTSMQMAEILDIAEQDVKDGTLDRGYFDDMWRELKEKVEANNEVDLAITNEIDKRILHQFGSSISTPKTISKVIAKLTEAKEKHKLVVAQRKEALEKVKGNHSKPVKKLNTTVSTEKVIK